MKIADGAREQNWKAPTTMRIPIYLSLSETRRDETQSIRKQAFIKQMHQNLSSDGKKKRRGNAVYDKVRMKQVARKFTRGRDESSDDCAPYASSASTRDAPCSRAYAWRRWNTSGRRK